MKAPSVIALFALSSLNGFVSASFPDQQHLSPITPDAHKYNRTKSLLSLHKDLINIESISGNEHHVGEFLAHYLKKHHFHVTIQKVPALKSNPKKASRFNVLAYRGDSPKSRVLVTSHIDTVPPYIPYELRPGNVIWGRGSNDAKGCVASQITAVQDLLRQRKLEDNDVALLFVVGEEVFGDGMRAVNDLDLAWEAAIFGEPTELKLAAGHKGILGFTITAHGKAGHSGYPELAESANSMLLPALVALDRTEFGHSEKYGNTTLNIGRMEGGAAANVVAEKATANVAMRLATGTAGEAQDMVRSVVEMIDRRLELEFSAGYGPVACDTDVEGFDTITVNYGTDVPNLNGEHKRYLYGPGSILVAHSDHEHVAVADLEEAVEGYQKLILAALDK